MFFVKFEKYHCSVTILETSVGHTYIWNTMYKSGCLKTVKVNTSRRKRKIAS